MTTEFKAGDKVTLEHEVYSVSESNGRAYIRLKGRYGNSNSYWWASELELAMKDHVRPPRLPKAGEVWRYRTLKKEERRIVYVDARSVLFEDDSSTDEPRYHEPLDAFLAMLEPVE